MRTELDRTNITDFMADKGLQVHYRDMTINHLRPNEHPIKEDPFNFDAVPDSQWKQFTEAVHNAQFVNNGHMIATISDGQGGKIFFIVSREAD